MSATQKQLAANRRNAQKSTGPKTEAGKAASSQNSLKHGLYSGNIIVNSSHLKEDRAEFDALVDGLTAELHPDGILQNLLVQKIAECFWRRRRLISAETAQINRQLHLLDSDMAFSNALRLSGPKRFIPPQDNIDDMISIKSIPKESSSIHFLRYEMRLDRQFINSLRLLTQLQKQSANRRDLNHLYDNPPPDHPCDSIEPPPRRVPPRHLAPRQKNEQTNPNPPNSNSNIDLEEIPALDHPRDSIKLAPRQSNPTAGPEQARSGLHDELEGIP